MGGRGLWAGFVREYGLWAGFVSGSCVWSMGGSCRWVGLMDQDCE